MFKDDHWLTYRREYGRKTCCESNGESDSKRQPQRRLIVRSDRGGEYAGEGFRRL